MNQIVKSLNLSQLSPEDRIANLRKKQQEKREEGNLEKLLEEKPSILNSKDTSSSQNLSERLEYSTYGDLTNAEETLYLEIQKTLSSYLTGNCKSLNKVINENPSLKLKILKYVAKTPSIETKNIYFSKHLTKVAKSLVIENRHLLSTYGTKLVNYHNQAIKKIEFVEKNYILNKKDSLNIQYMKAHIYSHNGHLLMKMARAMKTKLDRTRLFESAKKNYILNCEILLELQDSNIFYSYSNLQKITERLYNITGVRKYKREAKKYKRFNRNLPENKK